MVRDHILGTAGHIDHGKTALVKTLTGVDCDRLPEEKARGITIDLGFAALDLAGRRLGVVDVPGHERFIRNMLAGAAGIDLVLLVVAADDGVMPQTREHLDIVSLLGIRHGIVAVTKSDLANAARRAELDIEIRTLLYDTPLADVPLVFTSARTGEGIDELRRELLGVCEHLDQTGSATATRERMPFRLSIDRAFSRPGYGAVVTGSVATGRVKVGDEVDWWPLGRRVRVRSLQQHDHAVLEVHAGMRAALNLAGVELSECARGHVLAERDSLRPSKTLSVHLRCLKSAARALRHRLPVRLHIGTAEVMGTLGLLDRPLIQAGDAAFAQVFLDQPVTSVWGEPFVLRDSSAMNTLAGGQVVQPVARKIRRSDADLILRLQRLLGTDAERIQAAAEFAGPHGISPAQARREAGVADPEAVIPELLAAGSLVSLAGRAVALSSVEDVEARLLAALGKLHLEEPLVARHDRVKLLARLAYLQAESVVAATLDRLVTQKRVIAAEGRVARADHRPKLSAAQQRALDAIVRAAHDAPFAPPDLSSYLHLVGGQAAQLRELAATAVAAGLLVKVTDETYLHPDAAAEVRRRTIQALRATPAGLTVAAIRDLLGTTRKYAVPLCEYLDREKITRRAGDLRVLAQDFAPADEQPVFPR